MSITVRDAHVTVPYQLPSGVPQLPSRYVSRERLLAQLDRAADLPLTLLCAGPGAGKTALLAHWAQQAGTRVAWLSPAAADAETERFGWLLEPVLPDLPDLLPGHEDAELAPLAEAAPDSGQDLVRLLLSQAVDRRAPLVVIVDDAHVLSDPGVLDSLDRLIRSPQPWVRLILAARSDPSLPLHKYRLAGQMLELRAADLAMTPAEAREVLARHGVTLTEADLAALITRTEGWAAGVRLSAMRMEGAEDPGALVSQLAMDPGSVGEYLMDEVLRRLSQEHRRLLIETSFLTEVTGPLADAVTGISGCGDMLADLARRNCFVIPLDPLQTRYRYHHVLGEVLRYLLERPAGRPTRSLKQRAADWFGANDDLDNAVYWAVQAGNGPQAATLLARDGLAHAFVHRRDLSSLGLYTLLPLVPPGDPAGADGAGADSGATAVESAETAVANVVIAALCAGPDAAADNLERLRAGKPGPGRADPGLAATIDLAELILAQKACDADAVDAAARRLLSDDDGGAKRPAVRASPVPGLRAAVLLAQASVHTWHGRPDDVGGLLDSALAGARRDGPASLELEVLAMMALVNSLWSRTARAEQVTRQAQDLRRRAGLETPPALELATAVRAVMAGDFGDQGPASPEIALPDVAGADPGLATALALVQAGMLLARGEEAGARGALVQLASRRIPPALAARRDAMLADLDTSLGRPRSALTLLEGYQGTKFAMLTATARARAHLALGDRRQARECVRSVLITPSAQVSRLDLVSALLCDARVAQADGQRGRALELLTRAIEMARADVVLPFLQEGDAFADLLGRHPDVADRWPAPTPSRSPVAAAPGAGPLHDLADPLTQRELTILRLLSTSMSTVEIADELCLSANTVKTHLAAIYRKLPASGRREAVLRARELELI
jgi:LuxR family transcriptional regulator, maltose regulon positive regulatory protein